MGNDLVRRVRENTGNAEAVEKTDRAAGAPSLGQQIQRMQQEFALAMPRGAEAAQLVRDALTCLRTTRKLAECEPASVLGGLMTCAQLGLRPGVLGHAWLLPFWDSRLPWSDEQGRKRTGGYRAQLVIGYQGMVELAHRSGKIASLIARTVYENDTFEIAYGIEDTLVHKPMMTGSRGKPVAYYAVAKFTTGGHAFIVMGHREMEEYRDRYAMAKDKKTGEVVGPWRDQFEGMAHKTCVRQLSKWMPKSTEFASAIEADGTVRVDITPDPDALLHGERPEVIDSGVVDQPGELEPGESYEQPAETESAPDAESEPDPPADEPTSQTEPMATKAQLTRLHASLTDFGLKERADKLTTVALMVGRPLESSSELTKAEAAKVIDKLTELARHKEPARALDLYLSSLDDAAVTP